MALLPAQRAAHQPGQQDCAVVHLLAIWLLPAPALLVEGLTGGVPRDGAFSGGSSPAVASGAGVMTADESGRGCGVVLRRQPQGGYTGAFEIICWHCGDDRGRDYREVSPRLQLVRGPYPLSVGLAAYEEHIGWHERAAAQISSRTAASHR
jgi:hypothetical protein